MVNKKIISDESIKRIRLEVKNGKSKSEVAKELGLPYGVVKDHSRDIPTIRSSITPETVEKIRSEVMKGKGKSQIAIELGISYEIVRNRTRGIPAIKPKRVTTELIKKMESEIAAGKTKYQISKELGISYSMMKYYTRDICMIKFPLISPEMREKIRSEVAAGELKIQVAREFGIPYNAVLNRTRDIIHKQKKISDEQITKIRQYVLEHNNKTEAAEKLGFSIWAVCHYTRDIHPRNRITPEIKEKIRNEVKSGKPKIQVARELNLSPQTIYCHTHDLITGIPRKNNNRSITGNALKLLEEIMKKGYATSSKKYTRNVYQKLRKRFPNIRRVEMYGTTIYFTKERSNDAMRAFLEITNKKIMSGHVLQKIIKVFGVNISEKDKKKIYLNRRK